MDNASSTSAFDVDNEMNNEDALDDGSGRTATGTGGMGSTGDMGNGSAGFAASAATGSNQQQDSGLKGQALNKASELKDQAKQQAGELINRTRDEMKSQLTSQKDRIVDGLSSFAGTLRQAGDQCKTNEMSAPVADYAHQAAGYVERFSHELRNRDVDDVIREAEDMARRQPTLFIGGSFLVGMAIARFLKSGSPSRHALVPVSSSRGSADFAPNSLSGGNVDARPTGENRYTAHNYVPGVGVTSEKHDNTSGSTFSSSTESGSGSTFGSGSTDAASGTTFGSSTADTGASSTTSGSSGTETRSDNGV